MTQMHRTADALKQMMDHVATSYDVADRAQKKTQIRERLGAAEYQGVTAQQTGVNANANANTRIVNANGTVQDNHVANANIRNHHLDTGTVGAGQVINGALVDNDINALNKNGLSTRYCLRTLDNTGGGAQPFCSTPFMHLNLKKRLSRLQDRKELLRHAQGLREQTPSALAERVEVLEHNLLNALSMLMDYEGLPGDEREEWLATGSESARRYKELTGVKERDPRTNNAKYYLEEQVKKEVELGELTASDAASGWESPFGLRRAHSLRSDRRLRRS